MKSTIKYAITIVSILIFSPLTAASEADFIGDWDLTMQEEIWNGAPTYDISGKLNIEKSADGIKAYVDGGAVPVEIHGSRIEIKMDWLDLGDAVRIASMTGELQEGKIAGTYTNSGDTTVYRWSAAREKKSAKDSLKAEPADFSGVWKYGSQGLAKASYLETDVAKQSIAAYKDMDDNVNRCTSPGLVRLSAGVYPIEIIQQEERLTFLFTEFHEVRRVYLDGRNFPKNAVETAMGYSIGHWEGSTLVIETRFLKPLYISAAGRPLSENARIVERVWLSEDGNTLFNNMALYDSENYERPLQFNRISFRADSTIEIAEYDCDPHSYYLEMNLKGQLDEYFERSDYRR